MPTANCPSINQLRSPSDPVKKLLLKSEELAPHSSLISFALHSALCRAEITQLLLQKNDLKEHIHLNLRIETKNLTTLSVFDNTQLIP